MVNGYYNRSNLYYVQQPNYAVANKGNAPLSKPIESVQKSIENSIDKFVSTVDEEKEKKSTKKALAAGSAFIVIGGLIVFLNPKNASKILEKLKAFQAKNKLKAEQGKQSFYKTKFGKFVNKSVDITMRGIRATGNINNGKDILYRNICSNKRQYNWIKNDTLRDVMRKINDKFTNFMTRINNNITQFFDSISRSTVKRKYKKASTSLDDFELMVKQYRSKLPLEQQKLFDAKLKEIEKHREFLKPQKLEERFQNQEKGMLDLNLEGEVKKKMQSFVKGYKSDNVWQHTDENLTLWSEDILKAHREQLVKEGENSVAKLFGGIEGEKGLYNEILDITQSHLTTSEQTMLKDALKKSSKKLQRANRAECLDYYDKKRDLLLGGAPTDILTAVFGMGLGSLAIVRADSKQERTAKLFGDTAFPLVPTALGVFASLAMTAMLFSGAQGLLVGFGVTTLLTKLGSLANKYLLGYDEDAIHAAKKQHKQEKNKIKHNNTSTDLEAQHV